MSDKTAPGHSRTRKLPPQWKRPRGIIVSVIVMLLLLGGFYLLPPESGVYTWSDAIANALLSYFFGYFGTVAYMLIALARGIYIQSGFSRQFMAFSLCQFPLGLLLASRRKRCRGSTRPGISFNFSPLPRWVPFWSSCYGSS